MTSNPSPITARPDWRCVMGDMTPINVRAVIGLLPTIRDEAELQCRTRLLAARDTATRALGRWNDITPEQHALYGTAALTACRYATAPLPTEALDVAVLACRQMLLAAQNLANLESYQ